MNINTEPTATIIQGIDFKDYVTVKQLAAENPAFTEGSIRCLIFHCRKNGFQSCLRRIGRRVLISRSSFCNWIESKNKEVIG